MSDDLLKVRDTRTACDSITFLMRVDQFLDLVRPSYENKGGLEGQRDAIKTKSGLSIRKRLVSDLTAGAVIPPITIGILATTDERNDIWGAGSAEALINIIKKIHSSKISIIDGMQRTTALLEAINNNKNLASSNIRVEVWCAEEVSGLVYRMLVLNSGQIPWETARQLETIYSQLIISLQEGLEQDVELFLKDENRRRAAPGQFQASTAIRLFLAFSARRAEFDIKDRVAEDFAKLDAIESSSHSEFFGYFKETFSLLLELDKQFSRFKNRGVKYGSVRIRDGSEIFKSEPALIGFVVAVSTSLFDLPGFDIDWGGVEGKLREIRKTVEALIEKLKGFSNDELEGFLELDLLNERLNRRSGQVGRYERELFTRAFRLMIERGSGLPNMAPCWLN